MDYQDISFALEDGVATIALSRPEAMNSFSGLMAKELEHAYRRCDTDDEVRAVVLTGEGRAFCVGADMTQGAETFAKQDAAEFSAAAVAVPAWEVRKPVIAAMNGHAVGLGLTLALQCDIRLAADEGKYGVLQVRRGVMPDAYAHWTLQRIVGMQTAAMLLLTGRKLSGEEAAEVGLVWRSLPAAEVLPAALELGRDIARNTAPLSVAVTKKLLWQSAGLTPRQVERLETALHHHLMGKSDAIEGPVAYLERREPKWSLSVAEDWPEWPESGEPE